MKKLSKKSKKKDTDGFKNDGTGEITTYRFDSSIKYIFEGVDEKTKPQGPFSNSIRMLLVDNILNEIMVDNQNHG